MVETDYVRNRNIALHEFRAVYFPLLKVACTSLGKLFANILNMPIEGGNLKERVHWMNFPSVCAISNSEDEVKILVGAFYNAQQ